MKKIFFNESKFKSWTTVIVILTLSLILIACLRNFEMFGLQNCEITRYFFVIGMLIQTAFMSRLFWFTNYVEWNKKTVSIKLNNFSTETIAFETISNATIDYEAKKLLITLNSGSEKVFKTENIVQNDLERLMLILNRLDKINY